MIDPTHARGGTLDLLMTDVPDLVWVAVVAPLGRSDHSSLSIAISMAQAILNLCVTRIGLQSDAIGVLPWRSIWSVDSPVERLNVHLSLLVECFVPTTVIHVHNKDKPWFNDDHRLAFDIKQAAHLRCSRDHSRVKWDEFFHYQRRANAVYDDAMSQFSVRSWDVPPLIGAGGGLVCESVGRADILSAHFDGKQSRDPVDLPSTFYPSPGLTTFAFRSREVKWLLLDLDPYGGTIVVLCFLYF